MQDFLRDIKNSLKRLTSSTMNARDAVQGSMGTAYMTIAGVRMQLGNLVSFEAKDKITEKKIGILGRVAKGTKLTSTEGTYTASLYFNSSTILRYMSFYRKYGYAPEVSFYIANDDPTSAAGRYSCVYRGVTISEAITGKLNVDEEVLTQSITGSYDDWDPIEHFRPIPGTF